MKSLFAPVRVFAFIHLHSENIWEFGEEEKGGKKHLLALLPKDRWWLMLASCLWAKYGAGVGWLWEQLS